MNNALSENILSDVYSDDLTLFPPDDTVIGGRGDKSLKVISTIENFQYTKNKTALHVELQPAAIGKCIHFSFFISLCHFANYSSFASSLF